ncbi:MAG: hypothetical protein Q7S39_00725 [Ignavibacteria bacterium]|nr:hypothetical protein [Ignavibacteria bacterium]
MSKILNSKGISFWLDVRSRIGHDWHWLREMFPQYFEKIEDNI